MKLEDYYSVKGAALKAGIPYMALHQRIHRGTVKVVRLSERIILIHKNEVAKLGPVTYKSTLPWRQDDPTRDRNHPLYRTYHNMLRRCYLPSCEQYIHYGGRGISVCEKWRNSFKSFVEDIGPKPCRQYSIGRIDNDGNYEPKNCEWQSAKKQANNRRGKRC